MSENPNDTQQVALGEYEGNVHGVLNELMERANQIANTRYHVRSVFLVCTDTMRVYFSLQTKVTKIKTIYNLAKSKNRFI